jgi:hypothetical protein
MTTAARYAAHAIQAHVATDRIAATAERTLAPAFVSMAKPILAAVRHAKTPAELRAAIFDLADHGPPGNLATGLQAAMNQAFLVGTKSGHDEVSG